MAGVTFEHIYKLFGEEKAVEDLTLDVPDGEFLVLVGPSGCGKTTSLRMLAGLEKPTYGRIRIDGDVVNNIAPKNRDIAMVFQSYALYPHMDVYANLAFGMRARHEPKQTIDASVREVADLLGLGALLKRRPSELSGGQRQRVALGRAIIRRPKVFLLDEPLSNLDAALRVQMRAELSRLHQRFPVTSIYVTHDQVEAMTMGDRIAVLSGGRLQQVDTPETLYDHPANLFVATFIGSPRMNIVPGRVTSIGDGLAIEVLGAKVALQGGELTADVGPDTEVLVGLRPEDLCWRPVAPTACTQSFAAQVDVVEPMGHEAFVTVRAADQVLVSRFPPRSGVATGQPVELAFDPHRIHLFDVSTEAAVLKRPSPATGAAAAERPGIKFRPKEDYAEETNRGEENTRTPLQ